jgi:transcriptional regulator with XRE-family HTH domain
MVIEKLKQLRRTWKWSQTFLARMLRVSRSTVSRWERGVSQPQPANQEKIDALAAGLKQAQSPIEPEKPPEVRLHVGGDTVAGDKSIGRDAVGGDVISTSDGTTYIIRESTVIIIADPEMLRDLLQDEER